MAIHRRDAQNKEIQSNKIEWVRISCDFRDRWKRAGKNKYGKAISKHFTLN